MALWSKVPDSSQHRNCREMKRQLLVPIQKICIDIHVPFDEADKAFMRA